MIDLVEAVAMDIRPLSLPGTYEVRLAPHRDERGYFMRAYDAALFAAQGLQAGWVQENESWTARAHTVRGLHFQRPPHTETKLVRVVQGTILDVFVDLRRNSPGYGRWQSIILSTDAHNAVYIPKGFAHGYCTLSETAVVLYKVDCAYAPEAEGGLRWDDATLGIAWPTTDAIVSSRDRQLPRFQDFVSPF